MTLPSQVTFWLLSSLATALLDASPGASCISVLPAVSTEHWGDLLPQLLQWSWRPAEEADYSARMLRTDWQHIFTVTHLCDPCIPVARKGSCFRLLGFTTTRWWQKNKTLCSQFFFSETFWYIIIITEKCIFNPVYSLSSAAQNVFLFDKSLLP